MQAVILDGVIRTPACVLCIGHVKCPLLVQCRLDVVFKRQRGLRGSVTSHGHAVLVYKVLAIEVPLDGKDLSHPVLQELEHRRAAGAIHLHLVHEHGIVTNKASGRDKGSNILVFRKLLTPKLGRWVCLDDQFRVTLE